MMRYFKGNKIEVLNYELDHPSFSWRPAEIISGNGHTYHVKYGCGGSLGSGVTMERVPRKVIRPCPPPVKIARSWVSGDIVEVFEGNSWKPAQVTRVVKGDYLFVRIVGFSKEFIAHASSIRVRQMWQEDRWVVIGKVLDNGDLGVIDSRSKLGKCILRIPQSCQEVKKRRGDDQFPDVNDDSIEEHYQASPRSMNKRPRLTSTLVETCDRTGRKVDAVEEEGRGHRLVVRHPYHLLEKVHAVASPHIMLGENYMHASLGHKATKFSQLDMHRRKLNPRFSDAESTCSSVGSCSVSDSSYMSSPTRDSDSNYDEADSSYELGQEPSLPRLASTDKGNHELELSAYRSTMFAFHASGPLTWEKEALLTNLRLMLHITNDEHLLELRRLVSANAYTHHSLEEAIPISL